MLSHSYNNYQSYPVNISNFRQPQVLIVECSNLLDTCLSAVIKSVCKLNINTNNAFISASGFFLKFLINGKFYYWLVSNEHVITKEMIMNKNTVNVYYNAENNMTEIKLDQNEDILKLSKNMI